MTADAVPISSSSAGGGAREQVDHGLVRRARVRGEPRDAVAEVARLSPQTSDILVLLTADDRNAGQQATVTNTFIGAMPAGSRATTMAMKARWHTRQREVGISHG